MTNINDKKNTKTKLTMTALAATLGFTGVASFNSTTVQAAPVKATTNVNEQLMNAPLSSSVESVYEMLGNFVQNNNESAAITTVSVGVKKYKKTFVSKATINMRKGAGTKFKKVGSLSKGKTVKSYYRKKVGGTYWYKVRSGSKYAWVSGAYLKSKTSHTSSSSSSSTSAAISYGKKFLGIRYVWGGTTPSGFDCSGYTKYVYKHGLGKAIPRTSAAQYSASRKISKSSAKPGDLVFFSAGGGKVTHVAIYAGNNKILHASSSKGVNLGNLYDGYWNKRLVGFGTFR